MARSLISLLQPHIALYLLMLAALVGLWRARPALPRRRLLWLTVPFVLFSVLCIPAAGHLAYGSLEWPYPPLARRPADTDAIVVLAGYVKPPGATGPAELGEDTLYRCLRVAELYRQGPRCPVLVSGGPSGAEPSPTCAEVMRDFLVTLGVAPEDVLEEGRSRTTYENAVESAALLRQRGLGRAVLVTDANSLLRAELCFRKQGIEVTPCGCYYRANHFGGALADFVPNPGATKKLEIVVHEWLGIVWYWLTGKI